MVFVILVVIWAAVLLPPLVRSRIEGNPIASIGRFRRNLHVLQCTTPTLSADGTQLPASWAREAKRLSQLRRRRRLAQVLIGLMASTLVIGLVPSMRAVLILHVLCDLAFAGYVAVLVQARRLQIAERKRARRVAARLRAELAAEHAAVVEHHAL